MPTEITAEFEIITPMFLGDASSDQLADTIRPPSIKGTLRFWWRALAWGNIRRQTSCDEAALFLLHLKEAKLFGAPAEGQSGGQGQFLLQVNTTKLSHIERGQVHPEFKRFNGARYLTYGLMSAFGAGAATLERPCFEPGAVFSLQVRARSSLDETVLDAIKALGLLGGLGSRTRRGIGSCALQSIQLNGDVLYHPPKTKKEYQDQVQNLLKQYALLEDQPPYTAFSKRSRIDVLTAETGSPYQVLNTLGTGLAMYRSWGLSAQGNRLPGGTSEKNFTADHDWFRIPGWRNDHPGFHPERVVFGLPHNYSQHDRDKVNAEKHERRGSPLMFHVHKIGNQFIGISTVLPAHFLHPGEKISAGGTAVTPALDWSLIEQFLDGNTKAKSSPRFPDKKPILEVSL